MQAIIPPSTVDPQTHRDVIRHHLESCGPCLALLKYARERDDFDALDAWRTLLAAHLAADDARREFDAGARRMLTTVSRAGSVVDLD
jgi:hypothetical protein